MTEGIAQFWEPGSPLAAALPVWEPRPSQRDMAVAVERALNHGGTLLAEAGCGVGKSLAYLLPLLDRVRTGDGPALVSTHTLNLQDQLLRKDLPTALAALGNPPIRPALAIGRGNYLCLLRLSLHQGGPTLPGLDEGHAGVYARLAQWAARERETVASRLPFKAPAEVWERVNVEPYACPGRRCPHAGVCHFIEARERLRRAELVLANHALTLSDLAARREGAGLLPTATMAVFDEAHHLEQAAGEHLGLRFVCGPLHKVVNQLRGERGRPGLWERAGGDAAGAVAADEARAALRGLEADLRGLFEGRGPGPLPAAEGAQVSDSAADVMSDLAGQVSSLAETRPDDAVGAELRHTAARLAGGAAALRAWVGREDPGMVYWAEPGGPRAEPSLRGALVDVAGALSRDLWGRFESCVLTSATLTTQGNFAFMRSRLGVPAEADEISLPSPFDFENQVEMHLFPNLPDPRREEEAYLAGLEAALKEALTLSRGRAFILFTSYRHLRALRERLGPWCAERGYEVLAQGEGLTRERMLDRFRESGQAVLFGAASFWEGVDVPGEALSCVAVCRLPFPVPDTPWEAARAAAVEAEGGSAFSDLHLPAAILRLKQGFGRLIRGRQDRGWFFLLDPRVLGAPYGRAFLRSLPKCRVVVE